MSRFSLSEFKLTIRKMWDLIEYLKQPSLVADIQKKFGVKDGVGKSKKLDGNAREEDKGNGHLTNDLTTPVEDYVITNKFWYFLFAFGTGLGDEIFYASFIPFWFWNIDGAVGRRVVFVWTIIMYIGQGFKDIIKWPRPTHPAKRLQKKWAEEYGMPSTHAMVAIAIPFSFLFYTHNRYLYSLPLGFVISLLWCTVICVSRIYFGMHTVLDVIVGLWLAIALMVPLLPLIDSLDYFWLTNSWSPIILIVIACLVIKYFPHSEKWTPTRGDTTVIISVCIGIQVGSWTNFQLGNLTPYPFPPPYRIIWPDYYMLGLGALRTVLGFSIVYVGRSLTKWFSASFLHSILETEKVDVRNVSDSDQRSRLIFIELASKFATYFVMGFNIIYSIPLLLRYLGIERPTFYTEI